ncbi:MAG TPA: nucleoside triphosphate pyrophosphohydrolase [Thermoanaerobaculia bacterium]|nr:nucleoside triphosphate pyrophosphohydrolase [Thermoanaerobaculia bacterium]
MSVVNDSGKVESALSRLAELVVKLRRECPWDREQTPETIRAYLLEECYETLEALDSGDPAALREELGDLLFQIFFLATLAAERGWFDLEQVATSVGLKMTERHPHVFGETRAKDAAEVKRGWESRKRRKAAAGSDPFESLPASLPAVAAAYRMASRAADLGFDWERDADVAAKIEEELAEWRASADASDAPAEEHEIGDLLLAVVNLARRRHVDPEAALRRANSRFRTRFAGVARRAAESGREISQISAEELDRYWEEAKSETAES